MSVASAGNASSLAAVVKVAWSPCVTSADLITSVH